MCLLLWGIESYVSQLTQFSHSGYIAEYFSTEEAAQIPQEVLNKKLQGYKCVLNSKTTEESMVTRSQTRNN